MKTHRVFQIEKKMELSISIALLLPLSCILLSNHVSAERSVYIVHMDKPSMPKAFSSHIFWYSSILKSIKPDSQTEKSTKPKLVYTYDNAFHGFSALISKQEIENLKKAPGFISCYADDVVTPDTTRSIDFLSLNTAAGLWPAAAAQYGKDVIIGVIDTGIWPESPSFKDDGITGIPARWKGVCNGGEGFNSSLCNKKIIGARYFNQGFREENPDFTITDTARDTDGHGSHVASIAAGNFVHNVSFFGYAAGTARGVAPWARLAVYKVLWNGGVSSDILAGIDQAVADGVDIISISLGTQEVALYENPLSIASFGAREKGILISFSAGNRGPSLRTIRSGIPWAVVVASGTVDRWFSGKLTLGNGKVINGWSTFPARATVRNLELIYNETLSACDSTELFAEAPGQSIIVCNVTGGNADFSTVMNYLPNSNLRAAIIISEEPRIFRSARFPFPGVVISLEEAREVTNYALNSASPTATIHFQQTILGVEPRAAPAVSEDSSRGPARSYERILKPDLLAPGVLILAAYYPYAAETVIGNNIFLSSDYYLLSGTSMACPHVSGTAALLKAAHPEWSPSAIQSAMMTTANPLDNTKLPIKDAAFDNQEASPLQIGSGFVDPNRALDPGLIYDAAPQDFVNLVCSMNFTREQTRTIIRSSYNCSKASADLNYPSLTALFSFNERGLTLTRRFRRIVTNVGDGPATYRYKLEVPENTTVRVQPERLVFRKKNEKRNYSLSIRYVADIDFQHRPGSITWIEENGKYNVRSPIMVSAAADNFE